MKIRIKNIMIMMMMMMMIMKIMRCTFYLNLFEPPILTFIKELKFF
jgi:hypothetical protein